MLKNNNKVMSLKKEVTKKCLLGGASFLLKNGEFMANINNNKFFFHPFDFFYQYGVDNLLTLRFIGLVA